MKTKKSMVMRIVVLLIAAAMLIGAIVLPLISI